MRITAELSLYPLRADYVPVIVEFIRSLEDANEIDIVVNQLSTQMSGELESVMGAISLATERCFASGEPASLVVKILNADIDIASPPDLGPSTAE